MVPPDSDSDSELKKGINHFTVTRAAGPPGPGLGRPSHTSTLAATGNLNFKLKVTPVTLQPASASERQPQAELSGALRLAAIFKFAAHWGSQNAPPLQRPDSMYSDCAMIP